MTVPTVTVPTVTVPSVTIPAVTVPAMGIPAVTRVFLQIAVKEYAITSMAKLSGLLLAEETILLPEVKLR